MNARLYAQRLTQQHLAATDWLGGVQVQLEPPLLEQLAESTDQRAAAVLAAVGEDVAFFLPTWKRAPATLVEQVHAFASADYVSETIRVEQLGKWYRRAEAVLQPLPERPLPGVPCPSCFGQQLPGIMAGQRATIPTIQTNRSRGTAVCYTCSSSWFGEDAMETLNALKVAST